MHGVAMKWYVEALTNYAVFNGRAQRQAYWMFFLINIIIQIGLVAIETAAGIAFISTVYSLAVLIPGIAVTVRRLHDTNHSGFWLFIGLIPLVGAIILLVFMVKDSDAEENQFGSNPKALAA